MLDEADKHLQPYTSDDEVPYPHQYTRRWRRYLLAKFISKVIWLEIMEYEYTCGLAMKVIKGYCIDSLARYDVVSVVRYAKINSMVCIHSHEPRLLLLSFRAARKPGGLIDLLKLP